MRLRSVLLGVSLGLLLSIPAVAGNPAVPPAVQRAIQQIFGGTGTQVEHEREGGVDVYEVKTPARLEVVLDAQGQVAEIEVAIPPGLVPPATLAAARAALPRGARVDKTELLVRGAQLLYEIEARAGADEVEIVVDAGGKVVSQQIEQDEDEDDD